MSIVGRDAELRRLNKYYDDAQSGKGRVVFLEGPAGIGKTALLNEFLKGVDNAEILISKGTPTNKYIPYSAISQAMSDYGGFMEARKRELENRIREFANRIKVHKGMVFVDEIGNGGAFRIYKALKGRNGGMYLSPRIPEGSDGYWLTTINTEINRVDPRNPDFEIYPLIHKFLNEDGKKVLFIENINYLVYIHGIDVIINLLSNIRRTMGDSIVLVSGRTEYLSEEELKSLYSLFDERYLIEYEEEVKNPTVILQNDVPRGKVLAISTDEVKGARRTVIVGPRGMDPARLEFEIFDSVCKALNDGMDIYTKAFREFVIANGRRKMYEWFKSMKDCAILRGRRIYISDMDPVDALFFYDLIDDGKFGVINREEGIRTRTYKFYEQVYNFLRYKSAVRPLIIIFENLQWMDLKSLEVIHFLSKSIRHNRILILLTYRSEELMEDRDYLELISEIQREETARIMRLKPLSKEDVGKLIKSAGLEADLEEVYEASGGNPLLALNIAKLGPQYGEYPETIRESIEAQLGTLDDYKLTFLRYLSAVGDEIPMELATHFFRDAEDLVKDLNSFLQMDGGWIKFRYPVAREAVYSTMSREARMKIHTHLGEWFQSKNDIFRAAYHFFEARDERALNLLRKSAEESLKVLAYRSAIEYLSKAIIIAKRYKRTDVMWELYKHMGEWYMILGEYRKAIEMFEEALKYLPEDSMEIRIKIASAYRQAGLLDDAFSLLQDLLKRAKGIYRARILGEIGIIHWERGDLDAAQKYIEEYKEEAEKHGSKVDIVRSNKGLSFIYFIKDMYEEAFKYGSKALALAEEIEDALEIQSMNNLLGILLIRMGNPEKSLEFLHKALEISEKIGNFERMCSTLNNIGITYERMGDMVKAEEYYLRAVEIAEKINDIRLLETFYLNMGITYSKHGKYQLAFEYMDKSLEISKRLKDKISICDNLIYKCFMGMDSGDYEESIGWCEEGLKIAEEHGYTPQKVQAYVYLAKIYNFRGDFERAKEYLEKASRYIDELDNKYIITDYYTIWGEHYILLGEYEKAREELLKAIGVVNEVKDADMESHLTMLMAYVECMLGRYEEAQEKFEKVRKLYSEWNYVKDTAELLKYYGKCLARIDKEKAREILEESRKIYLKMEMPKKVKEIEDFIREQLS